MGAVAGYLARVRINSTNLRASRWSVAWKVDEFDTTTFENFGMGQYTPGLLDFDISFDAFYDPLDNPFQPALSLQPGLYASLQIIYDKTGLLSTGTWVFPNVLLCTVNNDTSPRDVIRFSVTAKASGYTLAQAAFSLPSG